MMAYLNQVLLLGNLTRDPELRYTPKGMAVADLGLAVNRAWSDDQGQRQEETTFVDVTVWGRQAELAREYLVKGRGVLVEGRLQVDSWEDRQSGQRRHKLKVVAENLQFLPDGRGHKGGDGVTRSLPTDRSPRRDRMERQDRNLEELIRDTEEYEEIPF